MTDSVQSRINALSVGESYAFAERVSLNAKALGKAGDLVKVKEHIRGRVGNTALRAYHHTGNQFTVESGEFITKRTDALMIVFVITRES